MKRRDHGGDLDRAKRLYGGDAEWIDLSTGINRLPYPIPAFSTRAWHDLPTHAALDDLKQAAAQAYATTAAIAPLAGAQAAIQLLPRLIKPGRARILGPTYNEHAASLKAAGWQVEECAGLEALAGADLAVVVNPNNPDGKTYAAQDLLALHEKVGALVVDESFGECAPRASLAPHAGRRGLFVLRSFGKFYGLAGARLGFVIGADDEIATLADMAGPWPVTGPTISLGAKALRDEPWRTVTATRLVRDAAQLDALATKAGWTLVGGTSLFRLYDVGEAVTVQMRLARAHIWSRVFPYRADWLRLGLPGAEAEWARVSEALSS